MVCNRAYRMGGVQYIRSVKLLWRTPEHPDDGTYVYFRDRVLFQSARSGNCRNYSLDPSPPEEYTLLVLLFISGISKCRRKLK